MCSRATHLPVGTCFYESNQGMKESKLDLLATELPAELRALSDRSFVSALYVPDTCFNAACVIQHCMLGT